MDKLKATNIYAVHSPHGPPVSRDTYSTGSKNITVTNTTAEYIQVSVEGNETLGLCNNYKGANSLKEGIKFHLKKNLRLKRQILLVASFVSLYSHLQPSLG